MSGGCPAEESSAASSPRRPAISRASCWVQPVPVSAFFPFREILLPDGLAANCGEDGVDLGQRIEPRDEVASLFAFAQAMVESLSNETWQSRDFSGASHGWLIVDRRWVSARGLSYFSRGWDWSDLVGFSWIYSEAMSRRVVIGAYYLANAMNGPSHRTEPPASCQPEVPRIPIAEISHMLARGKLQPLGESA